MATNIVGATGIDKVQDGIIVNADIDTVDAGKLTGTVADARISTLTASKLTGALPAISGANLTGVGVTGITSSANATAITIDSAENVGIGVTSPAEVLHIREPNSGSDTTLLIDEVNGNNAQIKIQSNRDNSSTYRGANIFNYGRGNGDTTPDVRGSTIAMKSLQGSSAGKIKGKIEFYTANDDTDASQLGFVQDYVGNVAVRSTPTSFYSGYAGLQVGGNGTLWGQSATGGSNNFWMGQNVRAGTDGSEKAITTGTSSAIHMSGGSIQLYCSNSVSADANITKRYFCKFERDSDTALAYKFGNWVGNGTGQGLKFTIDSNQGMILTETHLTSQRDIVHFNNGNGLVGKIRTSGSSTSYVTSSDYRLKENVNYTWDATTRLKQLKPARFNFKADDSLTLDGFLAHEVSDIVPEAISGEKDAMITEELYVEGDYLPDGKNIGDVKVAVAPDYQGIDQSKLVPLLVKTIQELEARLTAGGL